MSIAEKLTTIAENQQRVYDAGYESGYSDGGSGGNYDLGWSEGHTQGYEEGYTDGETVGIEQGKQAQEDAFWDEFQNYGKRTDYRYCFEYSGITTFIPKYTFAPKKLTACFTGCTKLATVDWDKFDLSNAEDMYAAFQACQVLKSVDVDIVIPTTYAGAFQQLFRWCYALERVQKITAFPSANWQSTFVDCRALTHIIFDGTIGTSGLNLQWSTQLDKESITSIINALSTSTSGLSITLSKTAVTNAFGSTTASEWTTLVSSRSNWTISLV